MGSKILHVLYQHQCDWCGKKSRTKHPIPTGWFKTSLEKIFCKVNCLHLYEEDSAQQAILREAQRSEEVELKGRRPGRRYHHPG